MSEIEREIRRNPTMNERFLLGLLDETRRHDTYSPDNVGNDRCDDCDWRWPCPTYDARRANA